jgi:hypothetical protein
MFRIQRDSVQHPSSHTILSPRMLLHVRALLLSLTDQSLPS